MTMILLNVRDTVNGYGVCNAYVLDLVLTYPLGLWQEMQPDKNPFVTEFCSIFDGKVTLHEQVDAYAEYIANKVQEACKDSPSITACLDTHDPRSPMYTDLKSENRPWFWQVCTEYAYWQTAAPLWQTSVVSRKLTTHWYQHQCPYMFGEHEVPRWPEWRRINEEYKGWYLRLTRTFWIDGEWDPWRTLSVQSDNAPDRYSWNDDAEFVVLPESVHHWVSKKYSTIGERFNSTHISPSGWHDTRRNQLGFFRFWVCLAGYQDDSISFARNFAQMAERRYRAGAVC